MNIAYRFTFAVLLAALVLPATAWAQDAPVVEEKEIKVEVRDGQVFVNGQLTEKDDEGEYWVEDQDGSKTRVFVNGDGENVFVMRRGGNEGGRRRMRELVIEREGSPGRMVEFMHQMGDAPMPPGSPVVMSRRMRDRAAAEMAPPRELMDLEHELHELAAKAKDATGNDRKKLLEELDQKLGTAFDLKMTHQREMLAKHESEIAAQRERLKKRQDARADIMRRRRAELLGERDGLDW